MKLFFIDDSYQQKTGLYGHGGFIIDEAALKGLTTGLRVLKQQFSIPQHVELKWSPDPKHYLRTKFKKDRTPLYAAALKLLEKHNAIYLCAVHRISECYGPKMHGWTGGQVRKWCTEKQIEWLAERFQSPLLKSTTSNGIMILDRMSSYTDEKEIARTLEFDLLHGTRYQQLSNIVLNLLSADSSLCPPLELADLVVGVTTNWLGNGHWSQKLFPLMLDRFLYRYYLQPKLSFSSNPSSAIFGYGLKLFPAKFQVDCLKLFDSINGSYIYTEKGLEPVEIPF